MATKKVFGAGDVAPVVLYVKRDADAEIAYPLLAQDFNKGAYIPPYDQRVIDEADPNNVTITYKLSSTTVATETIVVSGSTTTITMTYA